MNAPGPAGRPRLPLGFLTLGLALLLALWLLRRALAPFFVAMVLAYLMAPLVEGLARRMARAWAVTLVLLGSLGACVLAAWRLGAQIAAQTERLVQIYPSMRLAIEAKRLLWLQTHPALAAKVRQLLEGLDPMAILKGLGGAGFTLLGSFLHGLALILVPLILYYLLLEGPEIQRWIEDLVPVRHRAWLRPMVLEIHHRLGGYIRGQLAVTLAMGLLQGAGLALMGVPYAWILGAIAGVSNVVPYSPYLTALPPALLLAGLGGAGWGHILLIALVFTAVQKCETLYFTPVWVGRASGLHPLEVLVAVLAFGYAFGVLGLIFAVPLMIVLKVVAGELLKRYRRLPWFQGEAPEPAAPGQSSEALR